MTANALGEFLRGRRAEVTPGQAGVISSGVRRVPGLRREEVALLAGVSVDYYVRLEQGRERHPSVQVLDALSRALRLDEDGRTHLHRLAGLSPRADPGHAIEHIDPQLRQLLDMWPNNPALVLGRAYDVLATNRIGEALFGPAGNLAFKVFLDPAGRTFYPDWPEVARATTSGLRLASGAAPHDPVLDRVIRTLTSESDAFRELWTRNDARGKTAETKRVVHPQVGPLTLTMHAFDVRSSPGQQLVVYHAEPGSRSAQALTLLGSLAATFAQ
ncbi:helix-turn-helix domain-containing protein [Winogradskya humida]|uniref:Transcriptional regulator n=1 Tax=Winogradskya humida TaxID=113566 RepID=A0ABQ3ZZ62_9ACTN|nr:helix-turn-helix transcriptional regulator [Actinoplanes humidus]GIE23866.1 transcriptional regulator [Actinoplanes humidus]